MTDKAKLNDLLEPGERERDDIGLAGAQAKARPVRAIAQLIGEGAHPFLGFLTDVWGVA